MVLVNVDFGEYIDMIGRCENDEKDIVQESIDNGQIDW